MTDAVHFSEASSEQDMNMAIQHTQGCQQRPGQQALEGRAWQVDSGGEPQMRTYTTQHVNISSVPTDVAVS